MTRAAIYVRISQDQTGEHLGVDRQREDCQEIAERAGWEVVETYVDNDTSAYKNRPEFNRMLEDIKHDKIDAIVAWAPDRIYRRMRQLEDIIEFIEAHGTQIRTVRAGDFDLATAYGRMLARILGSVAAGEGEIKSERWKRSWRQRREAGDFAQNGRRTFGYSLTGEIIPEEQEVVVWMTHRILTGTPYLTLCRELQGLEVTTTEGNPWTPQGVKRLLTNPRIAGWSAMSGKIVAEGDWEPLIDRETFEGVRAILNSSTRPYVPRKALLTKLLACGNCGHHMITSGQKGKRTYRCPSRPNMQGCGKVSGNAEPIEEVVEAFTRERLSDPVVRSKVGRNLSQTDDSPYAELAAIELRIVELEKSLDDPGLSLEAILGSLERTRTRQAELRGQIVGRSNVVVPAVDAPWPTDLLQRRQLVDLVVEKAVLHPASRGSRLGFDETRVEIAPRKFSD
jgi:site-specific DNA recombinase